MFGVQRSMFVRFLSGNPSPPSSPFKKGRGDPVYPAFKPNDVSSLFRHKFVFIGFESRLR
jgi:hypothetical protein